jgi:hypothetical protein
MVVKSHGPRKRTREKFRKRGRVTVNTLIKNFDLGARVVIDIESSSLSGMPFKTFWQDCRQKGQGLYGGNKGQEHGQEGNRKARAPEAGKVIFNSFFTTYSIYAGVR